MSDKKRSFEGLHGPGENRAMKEMDNGSMASDMIGAAGQITPLNGAMGQSFGNMARIVPEVRVLVQIFESYAPLCTQASYMKNFTCSAGMTLAQLRERMVDIGMQASMCLATYSTSTCTRCALYRIFNTSLIHIGKHILYACRHLCMYTSTCTIYMLI